MCGDPDCPPRLSRRKREAFVDTLPAPTVPFQLICANKAPFERAVAALPDGRANTVRKCPVLAVGIISAVGVILVTLGLFWLG